MKLKKKYQNILMGLMMVGIVLCASDSDCLETFYKIHAIGGILILLSGIALAKWGTIFEI